MSQNQVYVCSFISASEYRAMIRSIFEQKGILNLNQSSHPGVKYSAVWYDSWLVPMQVREELRRHGINCEQQSVDLFEVKDLVSANCKAWCHQSISGKSSREFIGICLRLSQRFKILMIRPFLLVGILLVQACHSSPLPLTCACSGLCELSFT